MTRGFSKCRISIHALREEGDARHLPSSAGAPDISIHALREEGDTGHSTGSHLHWISIHALREEGDLQQNRVIRAICISIHALREEGDGFNKIALFARFAFLSTPSVRRATSPSTSIRIYLIISIHALREEGDLSGLCAFPEFGYFYPRPP